MKSLKTALIIVLLYPVVWFATFIWPDMKEDLFQDKCSMEYVTRKYEKNKDKKEILAIKNDVQNMLKENNTPSEKAEEAVRDIATYSLLASEQCPIPQHIKNKVQTYFFQDDKGTKQCPMNKFLPEATEEYATLKQDKSNFEVLEKDFYRQIIEEITDSETKQFVEKKWQEDATFRKNTLIKAYQAVFREEENCKNASAPMEELVRQVIYELAQQK